MSNLIFYDSRNELLKELYQWDANQTIKIKGADNSFIDAVHFCNCKSNVAKVVNLEIIDNYITVDIPNILLQEPYPITVYLYQDDIESGQRTIHSFIIPIVPRKKPDDYEYKENIEYISWIKVKEDVENGLASLDSAVTSAEEAKNIAINKAIEAEESAGNASAAAGVAEQYVGLANIAKASAEKAQDDAQSAAESVQQMREEVEDLKNQTQILADDVENNSLNAVNASLSASESKSQAKNAAERAESAAQRAESAVEDADLTNYVKNTDFASESNPGIVKVNNVYGLRMSSDHTLRVSPATESEVIAKTNTYKPIVPSNLDVAIKAGMTSNSLEWTEEEKASARKLIGVGDANTGNIQDGEANGSVNTINASAIADNTLAEGNATVAGSKAFKILGISIFPNSFTINGITITTDGGKISTAEVDNYLKYVHQVEWNLSRFTNETYLGYYVVSDITGVSAGMVCHPHFENSRGSVEFIVEAIEIPYIGKVIVTANFDLNAVLYEGANEGNEYNYLTILAHPELGDIIVGANAHVEGNVSFAQGKSSHAGGLMSVAGGQYGFAHGVNAVSGYCAFAMGYDVAAVAIDSFAIGHGSISNGYAAFAGGMNSYALDRASFAFGENAIAGKIDSKALGMGCWALGENQFVTGKYNRLDPEGKYSFILGNGWHDNKRMDAFKVDWDGNCFVTADVYIQSEDGKKIDGKKLVTKAEMEVAIAGGQKNLTWTRVQEIVQSGAASVAFPIGSQFTVHHDEHGDIVFDVVAHDYLKSAEDDSKYTMTLLSNKVIGNSYKFSAAGSNDYETSDIRELLNNQFPNGLPQEFRDIVGTVKLPCCDTEKAYEITTDKFYIPSYIETAGYANDTTSIDDGSIRLPYFEDGVFIRKTELGTGASASYMLRTPHKSSDTMIRYINGSDEVPTYQPISANSKMGFTPMCTIM